MDTILSLFYQATHIPVSRFRGQDILENIHGFQQDYNIPLFLFAGLPDVLPPLWQANLTEHALFGGFRLPDEDLILLGPVPVHELTMNSLQSILREAGRKAEDLDMLALYLSQQAIVNETMLTASLRMLSLLLGHPLYMDAEHILYNRSRFLHPIPETDPGEDSSGSKLEDTILGAIRHGRPDELKKLFSRFQISATQHARTEMPVLLRSYSYGAITLASRVAVQGGVEYHYAMNLCSSYIEQMIATPYARKQTAIFTEALIAFAEEVRRVHCLLPEGSGSLALRVTGYIESHIYEPLSPTAIASALGYTVSYLCTAFRRQSGMTVAECINKMKIEEAKRLLDMKSCSAGSIGFRLGYSSQSYFCTVFHRVTGMTPGHYMASVRTAWEVGRGETE